MKLEKEHRSNWRERVLKRILNKAKPVQKKVQGVRQNLTGRLDDASMDLDEIFQPNDQSDEKVQDGGNDPNLQDDFDGKQCFTLINLISVRFPEVLPGMFRSTAQFSTKLSKKILKKVKSASPYSMNLVFSTTNCMPLF